MDSILTSIKLNIGIAEKDTSFNYQLITFINSVFSILTQVGVGPEKGFFIEDEGATWDEYISDDPIALNMAKTYISLKAGLIFDPPTNSTLTALKQEQIKEYEWRLNISVDPKIQNGEAE